MSRPAFAVEPQSWLLRKPATCAGAEYLLETRFTSQSSLPDSADLRSLDALQQLAQYVSAGDDARLIAPDQHRVVVNGAVLDT